MRVLLLNPPYYIRGSNYLRIKPDALAAPPLGLALLKSQLQAEGHEVTVKDFSLDLWEDVEAFFSRLDPAPEVVGVAAVTLQHLNAFRLLPFIERIRPRPRIVYGGPHVTVLDRQALEHYPAIDFVLRGEADYALGELIRGMDEPGGLARIRGLTWRGPEGIVRNPDRPLIREADALPFPDYSDYDLERYRSHALPEFVFPGRRRRAYRMARPIRVHAASSRGCPARCHFCFSIWGRYWIPRSAPVVVAELKHLYETCGFRHLQFVDDTFNVDPERVKAICQGILDSGMAFTWECGARVDFADREMFRLMKESGCIRCAFGVPSTDDALLKRINKEAFSRQVEKAFRWADEAGLWADATVLVGNLGETAETLRRTATTLARCRIKGLSAQRIVIFPETELYRRMVAKGLIDDAYWLTHDEAPLYTEEFGPQALFEQMAYLNMLTLWKTGDVRGSLQNLAAWTAAKGLDRFGVSVAQVASAVAWWRRRGTEIALG